MTKDRRSRPTPPFSRYSFVGGRRRWNRREEDRHHYYVDRLGGTVWLLLVSIFLFQFMDAVMTLAHLRRGGAELNPLMGALIARGDGVFLATKLVVSALGLWFLGIHKNFPFVRQGLTILFLLFLGVVGWHFYLALKMI